MAYLGPSSIPPQRMQRPQSVQMSTVKHHVRYFAGRSGHNLASMKLNLQNGALSFMIHCESCRASTERTLEASSVKSPKGSSVVTSPISA